MHALMHRLTKVMNEKNRRIDVENLNFVSPASFEENLLYSAHSDCIDSVICDGRFVMRGRKIEGEKEMISAARKELSKLMKIWIQE